MRWMLLLFVVHLSTGLSPVSAQDSRLLDCYDVSPFGAGCATAPPVPVVETSAPPAPPQAPLFTKDTMAPDTPPVAITMFNEPTLANIDAFIDWYLQREQRRKELDPVVKARLLQRLAKEPR